MIFNGKIFLLLLLAAIFVVACTSNKKAFVPVKASTEKGSVVYVYRPAKAANIMLTPDLYIAGVEKISIGSGMCKKIHLSPGVYAVLLKAIKSNTEAVEYELKIIKGQVHYLRVNASMKFEVGHTYQPYQRWFDLKTVSSEKALQEMSGCKDMDEQVKKKKKTVSVDGKPIEEEEAVFSIDRTNNPFSH